MHYTRAQMLTYITVLFMLSERALFASSSGGARKRKTPENVCLRTYGLGRPTH